MTEALTVLEALFLGIVQGLTEWLPVSSSAHLVLAEAYLGVAPPLFFLLLIHVGTLVVVVVFFRAQLAAMLRALARWPADARAGGGWWRALWEQPDRRMGLLVVGGTVPAVVIALAFRRELEDSYSSVLGVGVGLVVMGVFLWLTRYAKPTRPRDDLDLWDALWVGIAQGVSIIPSISRSGMTIGTALFRGVEQETAVRYSFLLSIPAILGATALQATPEALDAASASPLAYAVGTVAAMVVGYATLFALVVIVRRRAMHWFAPYCWVVGAAVVAWALGFL